MTMNFGVQIKLLQGAANAYKILEDLAFDRWFDSILTLDDKEADQLSCQIEPPTTPAVTVIVSQKSKQKATNNNW